MGICTGTVVVAGGGVVGLTAAVELRRRGWEVRVLDKADPPSPVASSTDISKVVRSDYGGDEFYFDLADRAIDGWHRWNAAFGETVYHEVGFLLMSPRSLEDGGFEADCLALLERRGRPPARLDSVELARRFPAWRSAPYVDGYYNNRGGWAPSGRVVEILAGIASREGVAIDADPVTRIVTRSGRVAGVATDSGAIHESERVLVSAGAWSSRLVPQLAPRFRVVGQPVFKLAPTEVDLFRPACFPVWAADISNTGWYGFPVTADGRVKVANHGPGREVEPDGSHEVSSAETDHLRRFLAQSCPALADAPIVGTRLCLYCDTHDGDFWIDGVPGTAGLTVAAGGSGHAFKFAPVLGGIVADAVEEKANPWLPRFAYREGSGKEDARSRE